MEYCRFCNKPIPSQAQYCPMCGKKLSPILSNDIGDVHSSTIIKTIYPSPNEKVTDIIMALIGVIFFLAVFYTYTNEKNSYYSYAHESEISGLLLASVIMFMFAIIDVYKVYGTTRLCANICSERIWGICRPKGTFISLFLVQPFDVRNSDITDILYENNRIIIKAASGEYSISADPNEIENIHILLDELVPLKP